eukprot:8050534-Karenia_brevis.AAC.1
MIPSSVEKLLWEHEREKRQAESVKKINLWKVKHGTPGDAAQPMERCLDNLRPQTICLNRSTTAASDPATLRES